MLKVNYDDPRTELRVDVTICHVETKEGCGKHIFVHSVCAFVFGKALAAFLSGKRFFRAVSNRADDHKDERFCFCKGMNQALEIR